MTKTIVVTGASSGIGRRICEISYTHGFSKVIGIGRSIDGLSKTKEAVESQGGEFHSVQADLSSGKDSIEFILSKIEGFVQTIDVVVHNAGVLHELPLEKVTWDDWADSIRVNLAGPYFLTQALLPHLRRAASPAIVSISSTLADKPIPNTSIYNIAKAGLNMMTKSLALELAPKIRVNAIMPAVVDTPMYRRRFENEKEMKEALPAVEGMHPMQRMGSVEDIAQAVYFLCSDQSTWITGTVLPVDGGMLVT